MLHGYLLTFSTYASHVQGDSRGSTRYRGGHQEPSETLRAYHLERARGEPVRLDERDRAIVVQTFVDVCSHRGWTLHAAHVRTEHAHLVVAGGGACDAMMRDFKAYSSRNLHNCGRFVGQKVWARRGDVRRLNSEAAIVAAKEYVAERQGEMMACVGFATGTAR